MWKLKEDIQKIIKDKQRQGWKAPKDNDKDKRMQQQRKEKIANSEKSEVL